MTKVRRQRNRQYARFGHPRQLMEQEGGKETEASESSTDNQNLSRISWGKSGDGACPSRGLRAEGVMGKALRV